MNINNRGPGYTQANVGKYNARNIRVYFTGYG
ncbi:hypothetical protein JOC77_003531 [Peribacillus deserti]|uniref:Uncharacterized protein n=1 Tax=Peribacillus deserti TaxID=673318 RepID=A0ABS2QLN3_9BACI|nr:hypothetical protein [Peribacillus deserti]